MELGKIWNNNATYTHKMLSIARLYGGVSMPVFPQWTACFSYFAGIAKPHPQCTPIAVFHNGRHFGKMEAHPRLYDCTHGRRVHRFCMTATGRTQQLLWITPAGLPEYAFPLDIVLFFSYKQFMNSKQKKVLADIFTDPVKPSIYWKDIENLFLSCGGEIEEARGSRIVVELNGHTAVFHRPHPQRTTDKGAVKTVREFLKKAGIK